MNMQENVSVYVKLTSKDIKNLTISKTLQDTFSVIRLFCAVFITVMAIFLIILMISVPPVDSLTIKLILIVALAYLFFIALIFSPTLINYMSNITNYKKSTLLNYLQNYRVVDEGIIFSSSDGVYNITWSDIVKIQELKSYLLITNTMRKHCIIPKRCFVNSTHLDNFIRMILLKIDRGKLKLINSRFDKFSPESINTEVTQESPLSIPSDIAEPYAEVKFIYNKKELMMINYKINYTTPSGIIISVLGIFLISSFLRMILIGNTYLPALFFALIVGIIFTLQIPLSVYNNISRGFKTGMLKGTFIFKFNKNCFSINSPIGSSQVQWSELAKVVEQKSALLLYATTRVAHVIPKSAFQNSEEQLNLLRKVISEKVSRVKLSK